MQTGTRMPTTLRLVVMASAAALVFTACGAAENAAAPATTQPSVATSTTAPQVATTPTATTTTAATTTTPTVAEAEPVSCDDMEPAQPPDTALTFYAVCGGSGTVPYPIYRPGRTAPTLERSLQALVAGTSPAERAVGVHTGFDTIDAAGVEVDASIDADGIAHIALLEGGAPWLPDTASWSSDQLNALIDPLWATVFAHDDVSGLDMAALCFEQIACDRIVTRAEWAGMLFENTGAFTHNGCTPESAWWSPERCTVEAAMAASTVAATVTGVAADDMLNVRSGPGTEFFATAELPDGAAVVATGEAAVAQDGGIWRLVEAASGPGWVNEAFLDIPRTDAEKLVDAFVGFAHDPARATSAGLPLASEVDLGLGPTILRTVAAGDLAAADGWVLDLEYFRAYTGPFSALDMLSRLDVYDVTVGDHPHCASPPVLAPDGYEDLQRISVQPRLGLQSSCLMWATVDFFVLPDGNVAAITLDVWEP